MKHLSYILAALIVAVNGLAAIAASTATAIFAPSFRSLKITNPDNFMAPPVIRLNSSDQLVITFDEIAEENRYLQYRLVHCNADWQPSRLVESEYIDGFNIADIEDFAYSENTFVHFVNYRIVIPEGNMQPLVSGNYLLQVFDRDNTDETLLQVRFMVSEDSAAISGGATPRTDMGYNDEWQQLDFAVSLPDLRGVNPYQDIIISMVQNGSEITRRELCRPQRVEGSNLVYQHLPELLFAAGNEYRRFESISNGFAGMNVDSLRYGGSNYHVWLKKDSPRALRNYEYDSTQHGRFLVREYNSTDSDLGADYITVNFLLDLPEQRGMDIYVDGEMTNNRFDSSNRLVYDPEAHAYKLAMPLKQGAYNYRYLTFPSNKAPKTETSTPFTTNGVLNPTAIVEGNKYETSNEYWVGVYYRAPGSRADRLIGFNIL
ncbi:MAG: DUF5103 domain-containing protein [Muribaculaceae bacterium]|nr:DUF5103 domain-containing protein [Muribaculaceae bacterium]